MLSILSTILSWDDSEREKAGLQKVGKGKAPPMRRKGSAKDVERSAEEEAAMNEVSQRSHSWQGTDGSHFPTYLSSSCSRNLPKARLAHHHPVPLVIYLHLVSNRQVSLSFPPRPLAKRLQHHTTSVHAACRQRQMAHLVVRDNYLLRVEKPAMAYRKPWRSRNNACIVIRVRTVMRHFDT
jgi:hypothetical protein